MSLKIAPSSGGRSTPGWRLALALLLAGACGGGEPPAPAAGEDSASRGGRLVAALRAEPRTLNPVIAVDRSSQVVVHRMTEDLARINRHTQEVEPRLASSWTVSDDGLRYTLELRRDVLFSDGEPFDADDVLFSFRVYLDEELAPPARDLLIVGGRPIEPRKIDSHTVEFVFAEPYAAGVRLFDSFSILPQHLLEEAYLEGRLLETWGLGTPPSEIAGLGPFRMREYRSGERLVLERNPHYWQTAADGERLPYLDELVLLFVASEDAQVIRFQAGETDVIERINPSNFLELERSGGDAAPYVMHDLGPALNYVFLVFNQNRLDEPDPELERRLGWFRRLAFRQAVSAAVDRSAVVRLAYRNRATPLWSNVSPGYRYWFNPEVPRPERSLERARGLLGEAGFRWQPDGRLLDPEGRPVEFSIISTAGNSQRMQATTLVQEDLRQLGMQVNVVPLEQRALVDRVLGRRDYDASVMEFGGGGDADPNPQLNSLLSTGGLHLWRLGEPQPATEWEAEIDELMRRQISTMDREARRGMFNRVQVLMAEQAPFVFLASPHVLTGAKRSLGGFRPAVLAPHTLWNAEELYWREEGG